MRPGLGRLILGVILLGAGIAATMFIEGFQWWGAIIVGAYYIVRGGYMMAQAPRQG